jgi:hypothetical protein
MVNSLLQYDVRIVQPCSSSTMPCWLSDDGKPARSADVMDVDLKHPLPAPAQLAQHRSRPRTNVRLVQYLLGLALLGTVLFTGYGRSGCSVRLTPSFPTTTSTASLDRAPVGITSQGHETNYYEGAIEEPKSNGRTEDVQWDRYSLILKGQRVFIQYARAITAQSNSF